MKLNEVTIAPGENVQDTLSRFEEYLKTANVEDIRHLAKAVQYSDRLAKKWGFGPKRTLGPKRTSVVRQKRDKTEQEPEQKRGQFQRFKDWLQKK